MFVLADLRRALSVYVCMCVFFPSLHCFLWCICVFVPFFFFRPDYSTPSPSAQILEKLQQPCAASTRLDISFVYGCSSDTKNKSIILVNLKTKRALQPVMNIVQHAFGEHFGVNVWTNAGNGEKFVPAKKWTCAHKATVSTTDDNNSRRKAAASSGSSTSEPALSTIQRVPRENLGRNDGFAFLLTMIPEENTNRGSGSGEGSSSKGAIEKVTMYRYCGNRELLTVVEVNNDSI